MYFSLTTGLDLELPKPLPPSNIVQYAELLKSTYRDVDMLLLDCWQPMGSSEFIAPSFEYHGWYGSSRKSFITLKDGAMNSLLPIGGQQSSKNISKSL